MNVHYVTKLGVAGDRVDVEDRGEVVPLHFLLEPALELQQRGILNEEQCEGAEITVDQRIADFAGLPGIGDLSARRPQIVDQSAKSHL